MFWNKKKKVKELTKVSEIVKELADNLRVNGVQIEFQNLATEKSKELSLEDLTELRTLFHEPPEDPQNYSVEQYGLGGWLSSCQFSIFEIVYNFGEDALPFLREVAWGEYDWTQGNAIELLIRFAARGIQREKIVSEIKEKYPEIRLEAQLYAIEPLLPKLETDLELKSVFEELMIIEEFKDSYEELVGIIT